MIPFGSIDQSSFTKADNYLSSQVFFFFSFLSLDLKDPFFFIFSFLKQVICMLPWTQEKSVKTRQRPFSRRWNNYSSFLLSTYLLTGSIKCVKTHSSESLS